MNEGLRHPRVPRRLSIFGVARNQCHQVQDIGWWRYERSPAVAGERAGLGIRDAQHL